MSHGPLCCDNIPRRELNSVRVNVSCGTDWMNPSAAMKENCAKVMRCPAPLSRLRHTKVHETQTKKNEHCATLGSPAPHEVRADLRGQGARSNQKKKKKTDLVMNSSDSTFAQQPHRIISQPHVAGDKLKPAHATMAKQAGSG